MRQRLFFSLAIVAGLSPLSCLVDREGAGEIGGLVVEKHQQQVLPTWRSALFPTDGSSWERDSQGRFLQDFSYAGYRLGEEPPIGQGFPDYDVTTFGADPTGVEDSTLAIQAAIDAAEADGGGIVFMPEGTFKVSLQSGNGFALRIDGDGVVLRGAGARLTRLYHASTEMHNRSVILVTGNESWYKEERVPVYLRGDLEEGDTILPVDSVANYEVGDWIVVHSDATAEWFEEHPYGWIAKPGETYSRNGEQVDKFEFDQSQVKGTTFLRQVTAVSQKGLPHVTIDIPIRYPMKTRDNARIYKPRNQVEEVGLENFSIGMRQLDTYLFDRSGGSPGQPEYDAHASAAVRVRYAVNSWVAGLETYRPPANRDNYHVLSHALLVTQARSISVLNNRFFKPQYIGGGGNGYMFSIASADSLYRDNVAIDARHTYSIVNNYATGNVLLRNYGEHALWASDLHQKMSVANLVDSATVKGDYWSAKYRGVHGALTPAGQVTSQSVFWNTRSLGWQTPHRRLEDENDAQRLGLQNGGETINGANRSLCGNTYDGNDGTECAVQSSQHGMGYAIGTSGTVTEIRTNFTSLCRYRGLEQQDDELGNHNLSNGEYYNCNVTGPEDFSEGEGIGETLEPQSLYLAQRAHRLSAVPAAPPIELQQHQWWPPHGSHTTAGIELSWKPVTGASAYRIRFRPRGDSSSYTANVGASTHLTIYGLPSTHDQYKVTVASQGSGTSYGAESAPIFSSPVAALLPTHDAFVRDGSYEDETYNGDKLVVKYSSTGYNRRAFLRFDLAEEEGRRVGKAVLFLRVVKAGETSGRLKIQAVSNDTWSENPSNSSAITWNNQPSAGTTYYERYAPFLTGEVIRLDITDAVNEAIQGNEKISLRLSTPSDQGAEGFVEFGSSENSTQEYRPYILLTRAVELEPIADTTLRGGSYSDRNYGNSGTLTVKEDAHPEYDRISLLRFRTGSRQVPVSRAILRLVPKSFGSPSNLNWVRFMTYPMMETGTALDWQEDTLTWGSGTAYEGWAGTVGAWGRDLVADEPVEIDVTTLVNNKIASDEPVDFGLFSEKDSGSTGQIVYYSREENDPSKRPVLVLVD